MVVGEEIRSERGKRLLVLLCCGVSLNDEGGRKGRWCGCLLVVEPHMIALFYFFLGVFSGVLISCASFFLLEFFIAARRNTRP